MDSSTVFAVAGAVTDPAEVSKVWAYAATWWGLAILLGAFITQWMKGLVYVMKRSDAVEDWLVRTLAYTMTAAAYLALRAANNYALWELPSVGGALTAGFFAPYAAIGIGAAIKKVTGYDIDSIYAPKPPDVPLPPAGGAA